MCFRERNCKKQKENQKTTQTELPLVHHVAGRGYALRVADVRPVDEFALVVRVALLFRVELLAPVCPSLAGAQVFVGVPFAAHCLAAFFCIRPIAPRPLGCFKAVVRVFVLHAQPAVCSRVGRGQRGEGREGGGGREGREGVWIICFCHVNNTRFRSRWEERSKKKKRKGKQSYVVTTKD